MQDAQPAERRQTDQMDPDRARALQATLGQQPTLQAGDVVPPFFHQVYFWDARPPSDLGADGHPAIGDAVIPDLGLPQRMWAGGALDFAAPLRLGEPAEKVTMCEAVQEKTGSSGRLAFVTLRHDFRQADRVCVTERQTLVYREDGPIAARVPKPAGREPTRHVRVVPDATLLFRYSALTFNGHRIHYDPEFARGPGGYAGLVVHGPLLAQWLVTLAQESLGPLARFEFRAVSPLILGEAARVCADEEGFWVEAEDGRLCMTASAEPQ
ncbi:acyl dehydratase [Pseudaestuariivita atlantica]|uniref:Acyl dehydratase n=1 Tax=Pseudaestuariivita atlantica TaxID=1317121 RepID=A0A0L1JNK9_9RHOB|nr:acyl dehydratase [Pseudaestuariivita atlantica]KNG93355.1 acyl dehydratase [Pseudaestuariivita atlantica]